MPFEEDRDGLHGHGQDWRRVWEVFVTLAHEPADEPFERNGAMLQVGHEIGFDLLLHESGASERVPFWLDVRRQFSFEDEQRDYAGMNSLSLSFHCDGAPGGRVPQAQRWGYAGRRREGESDTSHPEFRNWSGWVESWKHAVEASNSFKLLDEIRPATWHAAQTDA